MNVKMAIELLQPIPEEEFIVRRFTDKEGKCCAVGHLVRLTSENPTDYESIVLKSLIGAESDSLLLVKETQDFITKRLGPKYISNKSIISVNNGNIELYEQPTIKGRVIALLNDMLVAGY